MSYSRNASGYISVERQVNHAMDFGRIFIPREARTC